MFLLWRRELPINVSVALLFMQQQIFTECRLLPGSLPGSGDTVMDKTQTSALQEPTFWGEETVSSETGTGRVKSLYRCQRTSLCHMVPQFVICFRISFVLSSVLERVLLVLAFYCGITLGFQKSCKDGPEFPPAFSQLP